MSSAPSGPEAIALCRTAYLDALLRPDPSQARDIVARALADGITAFDLVLHVLPAALTEIGDRWMLGELNVAQEHLATAVTQEVIASLAGRLRAPPLEGRLAIVSATPGEQHVLGAQLLALLLEGRGWEVYFLGASTPAADLAALVERERPDVLALSTTTAGRVGGAIETLRAVARLPAAPLLVCGGGLYHSDVASLARASGADVVTSDIEAALAELQVRFPVHQD